MGFDSLYSGPERSRGESDLLSRTPSVADPRRVRPPRRHVRACRERRCKTRRVGDRLAPIANPGGGLLLDEYGRLGATFEHAANAAARPASWATAWPQSRTSGLLDEHGRLDTDLESRANAT
jgi:hypothetical protein